MYSINRAREATRQRLEYLESQGMDILPITRPLEIDLETDEHYEAEMAARGGRDPVE